MPVHDVVFRTRRTPWETVVAARTPAQAACGDTTGKLCVANSPATSDSVCLVCSASAIMDLRPDIVEFRRFSTCGEYHTTYNCGSLHLYATQRQVRGDISCHFTDQTGTHLTLAQVGQMAKSNVFDRQVDPNPAVQGYRGWWKSVESTSGTVPSGNWFHLIRDIQYWARHDSACPCSDSYCIRCGPISKTFRRIAKAGSCAHRSFTMC